MIEITCSVCFRHCDEWQWDQSNSAVTDTVLLRRAGEQAFVDRLGCRCFRHIMLHIGPATHSVWTGQRCTGSHRRVPRHTLLQHDFRDSRSVPAYVRAVRSNTIRYLGFLIFLKTLSQRNTFRVQAGPNQSKDTKIILSVTITLLSLPMFLKSISQYNTWEERSDPLTITILRSPCITPWCYSFPHHVFLNNLSYYAWHPRSVPFSIEILGSPCIAPFPFSTEILEHPV